ncbi:cysteine--1-D-myo-inosityl 2-amino-2-deoxy-alpha-D-glucopyranoside ligase [Micrococcoides hystricis]|uniref:L-cysteine:1D-myo-inositol 2-amino-2-deoxy-alpha-D-glucopyranoside ligase n=1 Tax=Micrococcoides hystricis TaxID=1572761 RepID=A0ABV6P9D7_9MICC
MQSWTVPEPPKVPAEKLPVRLFDTQTGKLENVQLAEHASMYVCGITPYDSTHLGHANTYVAFDLLNRLWRSMGLKIRYTQNVTDIDDPLLERANATGVDWQELAQSQIDLFHSDMVNLNVLAPDHYLGAVETIPWVVEVVTDLLNMGLAYRVEGTDGEPDGDIYFDIAATEKTGAWTLGEISQLSRDEMAEIFPQRGGDPQRPGKKDPLDPLLWRVARDGEPQWEGGELGAGRPGWHIECSAISRQTLPAPFTVQGGGSDLAFPHHEFSAAHAMGQTNTALADHFVHAGMVGLDGEKMSKSLGNLIFVSKLTEAGHEPAAIRTLLLDQHYRNDWSYTDELLTAAEQRLARWRQALPGEKNGDGAVLLHQLRTALADDLNAPAALRAIDQWADVAAERDPANIEEITDGVRVADAVNALTGIVLS